MTNCKECNHFGVCVIRSKLENQTIMKFPDEKVAVVESVVISCDHFVGSESEPKIERRREQERREPEYEYDDPGPVAPDMRGSVPQSMESEVLEFSGPGSVPVRREVSYMPEMRQPIGMPPAEPARAGGPIRLKLGSLTQRR